MQLTNIVIFGWLSLLQLVHSNYATDELSNLQIEFQIKKKDGGEDGKSFKMLMDEEVSFQYQVHLDKLKPFEDVIISIKPVTLSPQFDIIEFAPTNSSSAQIFKLSNSDLEKTNYIYNSSFDLKATYIGHATIDISVTPNIHNGTNETIHISSKNKPEITITRNKGAIDGIFLASVIVFTMMSYINLGAQIDSDNVKRLVETPKIVLMGFLIGCTVMPASSWLAGRLFFKKQPMFRIGSFIYACGPAASASVLWTVMFDADKELALALQISSTIGALFTMPLFVYTMDKSLQLEGNYAIKVPYANIASTLIMLLVALCIGSRLVARSAKAKKISQKIFRPLTMFVLLFIIVFSSIVYWYIYRMFDWAITRMAIAVTSATYIFSGLLGYAINKDIDNMITISISSTYRNSGIAFAALVVAFDAPDTFIAYVPCLTQVVTTSLIGLVLYSIKSLKNCLQN